MGSQVSPVPSQCMALVTTCKMKSLGQVMMASCSEHLHVSLITLTTILGLELWVLMDGRRP